MFRPLCLVWTPQSRNWGRTLVNCSGIPQQHGMAPHRRGRALGAQIAVAQGAMGPGTERGCFRGTCEDIDFAKRAASTALSSTSVLRRLGRSKIQKPSTIPPFWTDGSAIRKLRPIHEPSSKNPQDAGRTGVGFVSAWLSSPLLPHLALG